MLCSLCNKNLATIHIQEVINGAKKSLHICQSCADAKGIGVNTLIGINLAELFKTTQKTALPPNSNTDNVPNKLDLTICPLCRWDSEKLKKTGRLGCPECYKAFSGILENSIPTLHRGISHVGKKPFASSEGKKDTMADISRLQVKLDKLVQNENYEEAALIRDKITQLKSTII